MEIKVEVTLVVQYRYPLNTHKKIKQYVVQTLTMNPSHNRHMTLILY